MDVMFTKFEKPRDYFTFIYANWNFVMIQVKIYTKHAFSS
jgi:hypothetical protein